MSKNKLILRMRNRVAIEKDISDTDYFLALLYFGELLIKSIVLGMVATIDADQVERHQYQQLYALVRADGIGDWSSVLDQILRSEILSQLPPEVLRIEVLQLNQKVKAGDWQYDAVSLLHGIVQEIEDDIEPLPSKVNFRRWLALFPVLRNKTRGHGAIPSSLQSRIGPYLQQSIELILEHYGLFSRDWAFLSRHHSGKPIVVSITDESSPFQRDLNETISLFDEGVHIYFDVPRKVPLLETDVNLKDFFFPNGNFNGVRYEVISYITGDRNYRNATPYLLPKGDLPKSETQGVGELDLIGDAFSNLPSSIVDYIHRRDLESELRNVLMNDRHPVITLVGRGGIGKTSLALTVLNEIALEGKFEAILWFSSRDIDLLFQGPKQVRPHTTTIDDVAHEFIKLIGYDENFESSRDVLSDFLIQSTHPFTGPLLFAFDNFETVKNPPEFYKWIDTYIREPNKVLITTRHRDFKGDYPLEVGGMHRNEFEELIKTMSIRLGIQDVLDTRYLEQIYRETDGHPYVIRILLGEVAKTKTQIDVPRIITGKDEILDALFERSYEYLSAHGRRIFLTLSNWKSIIPQLALEAVLFRDSDERINIESTLDELSRRSFVDLLFSEHDDSAYVDMPLVARIFGSKKLMVSPIRSSIMADTKLLRAFGAMQSTDIKHGIRPRIERLLSVVKDQKLSDDEYLPILEFVAKTDPVTWLRIAEIFSESDPQYAKKAYRNYLENFPEDVTVWEILARLCENTNDHQGAVNALVSLAQVKGAPYERVSNAVNEMNRLFSKHVGYKIDSYEKKVVTEQLIELMDSRLDEANATDLSRLSWLCMHLHDKNRAYKYASMGLRIDPENPHCINIVDRLNKDRGRR